MRTLGKFMLNIVAVIYGILLLTSPIIVVFTFIWMFEDYEPNNEACIYIRHASTPVCGSTRP
jgi:hypothetical protein